MNAFTLNFPNIAVANKKWLLYDWRDEKPAFQTKLCVSDKIDPEDCVMKYDFGMLK